MQNRRQFAASATALAAGAGLATAAGAQAPALPSRLPLVKPRRLQPGDTVGLVAPAGATYERAPVDRAIEVVQALGFKVKAPAQLRARYGHFAGTDAERAASVNALFADPGVHGILALTGGSGCNRIVDALDYGLIRRNPKFFGGYSDLTSLINAIHVRTGLVTFHCPVAGSEWNDFNLGWFRQIVMEGVAPTLRNRMDKGDDLVLPVEERLQTLRPGTARGPLVGGNLAVLTSLAGSGFWPRFDGAVLMLEEINEYIYRVDRMLSQLRLTGALNGLAGVVIGQFTKCEPGDGFGTLTLDEVFDDYFKGLGVPVYRGASFGHVKRKFTLPVGLPVEIDATAQTLRLLEPAVV
jgi:muramoyltetrapeptide carboxypeptidase